MSIITHTTDTIHPEIPAPAWATHRDAADNGRMIVDEHKVTDNGFDVTVSRLTILEPAPRTCETNVEVQWTIEWPGEGLTDSQEFVVLSKDIPALIDALRRAHEAVTR